MNLNEYQEQARGFALYPGQYGPEGMVYVALKLNGEAGEVAEGVGKAIRDDGFFFKEGIVSHSRRAQLAKELGDVLWYVAAMATELGYNLNDIAAINIDKLTRRQIDGTIQGEGSDR